MINVGKELTKFLKQYPAKPFSWEDHYCAHFAHAWYVFLCQEECDGLLPQVASRMELRRYLVESKASVESLISQAPKLRQIDPSQSVTGDIVLCHLPEQDVVIMGIRNGMRCIFLGDDGKLMHSAVPITAAWRIQI